MTAHKAPVAQELYGSGQYRVATVAKTLGVSRVSIYRHLVSPATSQRPGSNLLLQDSGQPSTGCWRVLSWAGHVGGSSSQYARDGLSSGRWND
jgi:hypothetical protein